MPIGVATAFAISTALPLDDVEHRGFEVESTPK
jgi:predicted outer membrane lipoprotein